VSPQARRLAGFALRFAVVYGLLVFAWPWARVAYRPLYCGLGNMLFGGGAASAQFSAPPGADGELDIEIRLVKRGPPRVTGHMKNSSRLVGYMPTVSLLAFVLATPLPWKRRRRALALGLALVTAFVAFRMSIPVRVNFSNPDALQVYTPGAFGAWALGVANRALVSAPASFFVVPLFLWVLVAFRREDWELVGVDGPAPGAG